MYRTPAGQDTVPPTPFDKWCGAILSLVNTFGLQYYLLYGGGGLAFYDIIGHPVDDLSDALKLALMILFLENDLEVHLRQVFVLECSSFHGWDSLVFVFLLVRGYFFSVISLLAFTGYGLLPAHLFVPLVLGMLLFQALEVAGDYQLARFQQQKRARLTSDRVLTTGLWGFSRHPNYLGFMYFWIFHGALSGNPYCALHMFLALHVWILTQGVPAHEHYMAGKYGAEWSHYTAAVPALWPVPFRTEQASTRGEEPGIGAPVLLTANATVVEDGSKLAPGKNLETALRELAVKQVGLRHVSPRNRRELRTEHAVVCELRERFSK